MKRKAAETPENKQPATANQPKQSVAERTFGAVPPLERPVDFDEMRRMFEEGQAQVVANE